MDKTETECKPKGKSPVVDNCYHHGPEFEQLLSTCNIANTQMTDDCATNT